jgi:HAD superfamily hydrolase (TIGR01509 family)
MQGSSWLEPAAISAKPISKDEEHHMPLALLFDLDGTMVDTDPLHIAAWNSVLAPQGRQIDTAFYRNSVMGFATGAVTGALFPSYSTTQRAAMADAKEQAFRSQVGDLVPTAGLPAVLNWAASLSLPTAVVTNAPRDNALLLLRGLGLAARFPVLVIGEELARGKPDPLPYLTAMQQLGVDADQALAFEDSLSGVRAAVAAGVETIGLTTALTHDALRAAGATAAVPDFADPALLQLLHRRATEDRRPGE